MKHLVGEGYFLRALEYFFRLQRLGDFPIVKTVLPDEQEALTEASKRSPRNEVARFILSDLDQAISLMNNNVKKTRLSKNAALLLKSRVALFEATWEKYHAGTALVPNGTGWPGAGKDYNAGYQFPSGSIEKEIEFFLTEAMSAASQVADAVQLIGNIVQHPGCRFLFFRIQFVQCSCQTHIYGTRCIGRDNRYRINGRCGVI